MAQGGQALLLQAADGQHLAPQGDLTGHGHIVGDLAAGEGAEQGRGHGDAGGGAVFGHGTGGDVEVHLGLAEDLRIDAPVGGPALHHRVGGLGRLLHDVAQLAGQHQLALAGHQGHLDGQGVTPAPRVGDAVDHADLVLAADLGRSDLGRADELGQRLGLQGQRPGLPGGVAAGPLAAEVADLPLQLAHPRLRRVATDQSEQGLVGQVHGVGRQTVGDHLLGDQVLPGDAEFLILGVAGDLDHLQPVPQGARQAFDDVGGGDEEDLAQVVGDLEVVILKRVVLLRVEHLEQGAGDVAPPGHADLVHLVEQEDRVGGAGPAHALDDPAGQGADVCPPVAAHLGLVGDAAQADADEGPVQGLGHGLSQGGLADAGRAVEAEDRRPGPRGRLVPGLGRQQLAHGDVFEDALLDLVQAVVGVGQDLGRGVQVGHLAGGGGPGHAGQPLEVVAGHLGLGALGAHALQAAQLPLGDLASLRGEGGLGHLLLQLRQVVAVALAQLVADRLELLPQDLLLLALPQALLDLLLDATGDGHRLRLLPHQRQDPAQPGLGVDGLEGGLLFGRIPAVPGHDQIGQAAGLFDLLQPGQGLAGGPRHMAGHLTQGGLQLGSQGGGLAGGGAVLPQLDTGRQIGFFLVEGQDHAAADAGGGDLGVALDQAAGGPDAGDNTHGGIAGLLRQEQDQAVVLLQGPAPAAHRRLRQTDLALDTGKEGRLGDPEHGDMAHLAVSHLRQHLTSVGPLPASPGRQGLRENHYLIPWHACPRPSGRFTPPQRPPIRVGDAAAHGAGGARAP